MCHKQKGGSVQTDHPLRNVPYTAAACSVCIDLILIHFGEFCRLVRRYAAVNDLLKIAIHDLFQLLERQIDPVICHTPLREIVRADLLGTVARPHLASSGFRLRVMRFLHLQIIQFCAQHLQRLIFIFQL